MNSIYEIAQCNKECKKVKTATKNIIQNMYALQQGNKRSKGCLYFIITILKDHEANYNVLGEKWIRKQVYGVSDIFIIIIRKIPKLLCFLPNQANNLMFFSVTLWNFCISTRNSPPTHSPVLEVFLMYSLQISLSKIESWDHKEF